MEGVRKMVRSGSIIVEELFGNKTSKRVETEPAEIEYESGFSGEIARHKIHEKYHKNETIQSKRCQLSVFSQWQKTF